MQPAVTHPRWKQVEELGKGAFGLVYKVRNPETGNEFAAKIAKMFGKDNTLLVHEIDIHSRLTHPNIIQYITSFEISECGGASIVQIPASRYPLGLMNCVAMVIEWADEGDLRSHLKGSSGLPLRQVRKWTRELTSGMIYLKEQGIVHRDIKVENVLISKGVAKLTDFGLSIFVEKLPKNPHVTMHPIGTPLYQAPEILDSGRFGYQSDVWALGVVVYQMVTGKVPFDADKLGQLYVKIITKPFMPLEDRYASLNALLEKNPEVRIKIEDVLKLDFFERSPEESKALEEFRRMKSEFGDGTRFAFYMYLANQSPDAPPMSMNAFNELYDDLY